jgi:hypothetical protein
VVPGLPIVCIAHLPSAFKYTRQTIHQQIIYPLFLQLHREASSKAMEINRLGAEIFF